ncbi:MAG: sugar ABC transporter permease [Thaumarchaeota archaeon]|nr:sugar ABC transporter permease [Nitrososphaerota archaeon]
MDKNGYFLVVPLIAILACVEVYPLAVSVYLSVTNYGGGGAFVGLSNFAALLSQSAFWSAVSTSVLYSGGSAALSTALGILSAYLLTQVKRGRGYFEAVFLMPLAAAPIVAGIVWAPEAVWDDVNTFWHFVLGQPFFNMLNYNLYFPTMILSDSWEWAPMMMLVALAVLASVPKQVYEASEVFGASKWKTFTSVGLPTIMNSPVTHFIIIIRFVDAMRAFEIPFAWSGWLSYTQPGSPTDTLSLYLFKLLLNPPSGVIPISVISAAALILLAVTFAATTLLFQVMRGLRKI